MKIQEAIENLKYLISGDCTDNQMDFVEEIEMGIQSLEKQIPKKPKSRKNTTYAFCPCCDSSKLQNDYCTDCGQKIDWSETEKGGASDDN